MTREDRNESGPGIWESTIVRRVTRVNLTLQGDIWLHLVWIHPIYCNTGAVRSLLEPHSQNCTSNTNPKTNWLHFTTNNLPVSPCFSSFSLLNCNINQSGFMYEVSDDGSPCCLFPLNTLCILSAGTLM